jgi:predicted metal-dependent hydrolase
MARQSEKILTDPQVGEVLLVKSDRSRSISIRVHPVKGVRVSVPRIVPFAAAVAFYKMKRNWVLEVMARQRERFKDVQVASPDEVEALRRKAKAELPSRLAELAGRYGFVYNRVVIKHNATNWGSCSSKNNINLNLNIVRLPKVLQDYILLHELCHLRHHDHGHAFHLLLEHLLTDNLMKLLADSSLSNEDTVLNSDLAKKAAVSKARFPVDYTMSRAIKQYKLV